MTASIDIIPYEPRYQPDFKRLNLAWIAHYFAVEPHDLEQLDYPEQYVLPNGGQIFLARHAGVIVGCVAMVNTRTAEPVGPCFELAKMAVSPAVQGEGVGRKLCLAAIAYGRQRNVKTIWLESNRLLTPALTLYASVGFREVARAETPYARADIRMEMVL